MKILGIHGKSSKPRQGGTWPVRVDDLKSRGFEIYLPQFNPCEDPTYESWEEDMKKINIEDYDVVIASSHGSGVFARYVKENDIKLKRVVFCCPGRSIFKHKNTGKLYNYLETHEMNLEKNIDEIFIVHSRDDEVVPYSEGVKFQGQIGGRLITLEGLPHKLDGEGVRIINDLAILGYIHTK